MVDQIAGTNLAENSPHRWSRRHKPQGYAVDAVAQTGRFGTVLEDVALMTFAAGTVDFRPRENKFEVGCRGDHFGIDGLPEARPAGSAIELVFRRKERQVTTGTIVDACLMILVHGVHEWPLGLLVPQDAIGLW